MTISSLCNVNITIGLFTSAADTAMTSVEEAHQAQGKEVLSSEQPQMAQFSSGYDSHEVFSLQYLARSKYLLRTKSKSPSSHVTQSAETQKHCFPTAAFTGVQLPEAPGWGSCPVTSHKAYQRLITTVSLGEARSLQAPQSDVSLDIPEHSPGIYTVHIQTHSATEGFSVPDYECVISPAVEITHQQLKQDKDKQSNIGLCRLNIPHCLKNRSIFDQVKVYHIGTSSHLTDVEELDRVEKQPTHQIFDINQSHINVHTEQFSKFICTACGQTECQSSVLNLLFARMASAQEQKKTSVDMKLFLGSQLFSIQDFKNVSCLVGMQLIISLQVFQRCFFFAFSFTTIHKWQIICSHCKRECKLLE